jgi:hypothetical protein
MTEQNRRVAHTQKKKKKSTKNRPLTQDQLVLTVLPLLGPCCYSISPAGAMKRRGFACVFIGIVLLAGILVAGLGRPAGRGDLRGDLDAPRSQQPSHPLPNRIEQQQQHRMHQSSHHLPSPDARIALVTSYGGSARYLRNVTLANKHAYAQRCNLSFVDASELHDRLQPQSILPLPAGLTESERSELQGSFLLFTKLAVMLELLPHYDWLIWSDADALFLNFSKDIRMHIDTRFHLIVPAAPPHSAKWRFMLNTGHLIVRNSMHARALLQRTWALRKEPCDVQADPTTVFNGWFGVWRGRLRGLSTDTYVYRRTHTRARQTALCSSHVDAGVCLFRRCCLLGEQSALMVALSRCASCRARTRLVSFRDFNSIFPYWGEV